MSSKGSVELNLLDKSPQITILPAKPPRTVCEVINVDNELALDCTLSWSDLSYVIPRDSRLVHLFKRLVTNRCDWQSKCILHPQSGQVAKGQMIGIIGRSGSGKSTLLQCLAGCKQKNRSGQVQVILKSQSSTSSSSNGKKIDSSASSSSSSSSSSSPSSSTKKPNVKICYIPQADHLISTLTVYETLIYASKLRNLNQSDNYHSCKVDSIMSDLNLTGSRTVMVNRISGGQRKRLSIGLELLGSPDIFLLDEPTSGLDSSNALQCVQLLKKLANRTSSSSSFNTDQSSQLMNNITMTNHDPKLTPPPSSSSSSGLAIVASIHQPSAKILSQFDKIYLMSFDGRCIYFGPPDKMISVFASFELNCPPYHNPADFAIEIASGDYGRDKVEALENWTNSNELDPPPTESAPTTIEPPSSQEGNEKLSDTQVTLSVEDVVSDMLKRSKSNFAHFWVLLKRTLLTTIRDPSLNGFRLIQHVLIGLIVVALYSDSIGTGSGCLSNIVDLNDLRNEERLTAQNLALMFFSLMFLTFAAMMPTVMVFPMEMSVFTKERKNGWYSCASFYFAKTFADLPYQLTYTFIYIAMVYFGTGQFFSWWRFSFFLSIGLIISVIGQSIGLLFGALFAKYLQTAIFIAPISTLPLILISGFFVRLNTIPTILRPITYTSYLKYAFEALIITIYGYDRCTVSSTLSEDVATKGSNGCAVVGQFYSYLRNDLNLSFDVLKEYIPIMTATNDANVTAKLEGFNKALEKVDFNATQQILETINPTRSLVMTEYELEDANFVTNVLALLGFIVVVRLITYGVLLHKSEKKIDL